MVKQLSEMESQEPVEVQRISCHLQSILQEFRMKETMYVSLKIWLELKKSSKTVLNVRGGKTNENVFTSQIRNKLF